METGSSNIEASINILDEKAFQDCKSPILLGEIGLENFKFALFDAERKKILSHTIIEHARMPNPFVHANKLEKIFLEFDQNLNATAHYFTLVNRQSTLVPNELYDPLNEKAVLEFSHRIFSSDEAKSDGVKELDAQNVWACPSAISKAIKASFPSAQIFHFSTPLIKEWTKKMMDHKGMAIICHVQDDHFEIMCFENSKLQLYNSFVYHSPQDFLYYTLFTMEQCNMDPDEHLVQMIGKIRKADALYNMAYKYIRNVEVVTTLTDLSLAAALRTTDHRDHINLYNIHHCV